MDLHIALTTIAVQANALEKIEIIKSWLVQEGIILPEPEADSKFDIHYGGEAFAKTTEEDWYGEVEFLSKMCELKHVLGWDYGTGFFLPRQAICPKCQTNGLAKIDTATFYKEGYLQQSTPEVKFVNTLETIVKTYDVSFGRPIACPNCGKESLINEYDFNDDLIFTNCAIIFWNWPPLTDVFTNQLKKLFDAGVLVISS